jgi:hypothetical protein
MKSLILTPFLLSLFSLAVLPSCTAVKKDMARGLAAVRIPTNAKGEVDYAALAALANTPAATNAATCKVSVFQLGGQLDFDDGIGMKITADNQASFQHFLQAAGLAVSAWSAASQAAAKFAYDKFAAGELTKQQFNAQMHALQAQEIAAKAGVTEQMISGGAELGTVTAPTL